MGHNNGNNFVTGYLMGRTIGLLLLAIPILIFYIAKGLALFIQWFISEIIRYSRIIKAKRAEKKAREAARAESQVYYRVNNEGTGPDRSLD